MRANFPRNKRRRLTYMILAVSATLIVFAHNWWYSVERQARKLGSREFTVQAWAKAGQTQRAEMTASFLEQYDVSGFHRKDIEALLGPQTSYYDYDTNLAYVVGPDTVRSMYASGYLLVFAADKYDGEIDSVFFFPDVE